MSIDPIIAASLAPHLGPPPKTLQFPRPRPRPLESQIGAATRAHDDLIGHLAAGEIRRAIDAIDINTTKLRSIQESLGAFKPEITMYGCWENTELRELYERTPVRFRNGNPTICIDVTTFAHELPLFPEGILEWDNGKDWTYIAYLLNYIKVGDEVFARYEFDGY